MASWIVIWAILTSEDIKVPTTASAWRQLTKFLWPEIHKWLLRVNWTKVGRPPFVINRELLTTSIKPGPKAEAFAIASDNPAYIEGAHAERVVYVFDEAKTIPDAIWDAAEGALMSDEAWAIAISTPGEPQGRFYEIHRGADGYEDWWVRHVTLEETVAAGRISWDDVARLRRMWGEESATFQNRVLGQFATQSDVGVIPLAWYEYATALWDDMHTEDGSWVGGHPTVTRIGLDVGMSQDRTVFALAADNVIIDVIQRPHGSTMETAGYALSLARKYQCPIVVDVIGIGAGVYDRLREQLPWEQVVSFNAASSTSLRDASEQFGFVNKRAAGWWTLRELMDPQSGAWCALPDSRELLGELTAPKWTVQSGARIKVESKDEIRKRLGRSTDIADAIMMALYREPAGVFIR